MHRTESYKRSLLKPVLFEASIKDQKTIIGNPCCKFEIEKFGRSLKVPNWKFRRINFGNYQPGWTLFELILPAWLALGVNWITIEE